MADVNNTSEAIHCITLGNMCIRAIAGVCVCITCWLAWAAFFEQHLLRVPDGTTVQEPFERGCSKDSTQSAQGCEFAGRECVTVGKGGREDSLSISFGFQSYRFPIPHDAEEPPANFACQSVFNTLHVNAVRYNYCPGKKILPAKNILLTN